MATQGLVTVKEQGKVVMKVIAGCDGYYAKNLADALRTNWPVDADEAYHIANDLKFGCSECLVVLTQDNSRFDGNGELGDLYRETFSKPRFNPRWKCGIADYTKVVNM